MVDVQRLITDPSYFRAKLVVKRADGSVCRLTNCLAPFQVETFDAFDPAFVKLASPDASEPPCRRLWAERHRGASKTMDAAVMCLWALAFARRQIRGVAVAVDRDQAALIRQALERLVRMNPWLAKLVKVGQWSVTNVKTGSELTIMASDEASSYGLLIDFAVADEVALWQSDAMFNSILSSVGKKPNAILVALTNCGWKGSWAWDVPRKGANRPALGVPCDAWAGPLDYARAS